MVGILRRLFGSRGQADSNPVSEKIAQPAKKQGKQDNTFFLPPDEAKTLGNIEYMRTPKLVKHTFKDFGSGSKIEVVEEVSSLSKVKLEKQTKAAEPVAEQSSPTSDGSSGAGSRRQGGSDLEKFREMARSLRKK